MKTGYLITARLKSTRLKRKILLNIDGESVIDKVINRCKFVSGIDDIILCTSSNPEDADLENVAKKHNIKCFRGDEDDVLKRLLEAARKEGIDRFLSITADNPLHSVKTANQILEFDSNNHFDFIFTYNLPVGITPYFIRTDALDVAVFMKQISDTEIWGPFVNQSSFFKIGNLFNRNNLLPTNLRITCDYQADYDFIKALYSNISCEIPDLEELVILFKNHPSIFKINKGISQRILEQEFIDKIENSFTKNKERGLKYAEKKGISFSPGVIQKDIVFELQ